MQTEHETGSVLKISEYVEGVLNGNKRLSPADLGAFYPAVVEKILATPFPQNVDSARVVLSKLVPRDYWNLIWHTDALESMWEVPNYIDDSKRTESEKKLRVYALGLINAVLTHSETIDISSTAHEAPAQETLSSHNFDNAVLNRIGSLEKDGYEIMFENSDHGQDAFAKVGDTYVVSDGVSSHPRSGIVSKYLAMGIARKSNEYGSFRELFDKEPSVLTEILEKIAATDAYTAFKGVQGNAAEDKGSATFTAVKVVGNRLEYMALGDSPLMVVDTNEQGEVIGYELVTEDAITSSNYTTQKNLDTLQDPETQAAGIKNGKANIDTTAIKYGTIEYKKGRKIILASDFLTKLMVTSKEVSNQKTLTGRNEMIRDAYKKWEQEDQLQFSEMWLPSGALNPLFLSSPSMTTERLAELIAMRKKIRSATSDDYTAITLDLDTLLNR